MAKLHDMGRGLSELQKSMLRMSHDERERNKELGRNPEVQAASIDERHIRWQYYDNWLGYVDFNEVLAKVYGWTPQPKRYPDSGHFEHIRFSKKNIGLKRYMAAYIAVRKAAQRLQARGLISISHGKSYYNTSDGETYLMAKLCSSRVAPSENVKELSACSLYDGMYKCSACGVIFEPFGAKSFPQRCSFCGKRETLGRYRP